VHIIDLQEISTRTIDKKEKRITYGYSSLRIYYGDYGDYGDYDSKLEMEKYKEFEGFDITTIDEFEIKWQDDNVVLINVYRKSEDGTRFKDETIRLDTSI
jgi:hypothetical protein